MEVALFYCRDHLTGPGGTDRLRAVMRVGQQCWKQYKCLYLQMQMLNSVSTLREYTRRQSLWRRDGDRHWNAAVAC